VGVNNMIFTFSQDITLKRKVAYLGVMLIIDAMLFLSMISSSKSVGPYFYNWVMVAAISGVSLVVVAIFSKRLIPDFGNKFIELLMYASLPVLILILFYLVCIFINKEDFGYEYLILNSWRVLSLNIPLVLIAFSILDNKKAN
jgi:hypothetical protein